MNLAVWLQRYAAAHPTREALFEGTRCVADYQQFWTRAATLAGWLREQGVQPGDRVGLYMKNAPDYLIVFYAIWCVGAAVVPINAKLHSKEAGFILENSETGIVFASSKLAAELEQAQGSARVIDISGAEYAAAFQSEPLKTVVPRRAGDLAWLFYTSGTTGRPKGVMITFGMLLSMALCYESDCDVVRPNDAALYAAPLSHGAGIYNLMHVRRGARHVFPVSGGFDVVEIFDLAAHFGSAHMFAAPTMVRLLTDVAKSTGQTGQGLRTVVYAGGPMYNADIIEAVDQFGPIFVQIYGQGECPMGITVMTRETIADRVSDGWRGRLASVGKAQSAVEVAVADPDGQVLEPGEHGEIIVRGQTVMPGYWRNPDATADTLRDGWLMTGDMGVMDANGYLTLQDRSKDMIITGGSNVYPREVEEVLLQHPDVHEVSVVGRTHPEWGEEIVAFIVGDAAEAELDQLCLSEIARFKRPKAYVRIAELPKNNYGKILKTDLRELLKDGA